MYELEINLNIQHQNEVNVFLIQGFSYLHICIVWATNGLVLNSCLLGVKVKNDAGTDKRREIIRKWMKYSNIFVDGVVTHELDGQWQWNLGFDLSLF